MKRIFYLLMVLVLAIATLCSSVAIAIPSSNDQYLVFQIFTFGPSSNNPVQQLSKAQIAATVDDIIAKIGTVGRKGNRLGFVVGPTCFNNSDAEVTQLINDSFEIALEKNVAVGFHIDDSMFYGSQSNLLPTATNIEWIDWNKTPCTGRNLAWSATPLDAPAQLCFNSPAVKSAVSLRAQLISHLIGQWLIRLRRSGKESLFAGVIAGWETQLGNDFNTGKSTGYHALANSGYNSTDPPAAADSQRVQIVAQFVQMWASDLAQAGVPTDRIYSHIAFVAPSTSLPPGVSYAQQVNFATPDTAFNRFCRPGFSTYPAAGLFPALYNELAVHGGGAWASSEGTNINPDGQPGEPTMEIYLAKMFNHGATLVNIFGWGVGGPQNMFQMTAESSSSIAAYRKFLTQRK